MRGVVVQRIVQTMRQPRNDADEAIAPKPGWDGAFRAICIVAALAHGDCHALRAASRTLLATDPGKPPSRHAGLMQRFLSALRYTCSMLAPFDLDRIQDALRTPDGWIELIAIAVCFIAGWWVDRRTHLAAYPESRLARIGAGSINRLSFPVTTLGLLVVTRAVFRHWHPPVFFPIFIPLVVALALIRLMIYAFRNIVGTRVGVSERAVALVIWGALLLYYVGLLPEIASALDEVRVPVGKSEVSVLDIGRDAIFVVVAIALSLWAARLIERRLMRMSHLDNNLRVVLGKVFRALLI